MNSVITCREYLVTVRFSGEQYLTERKVRSTNSGKYRWVKDKNQAVRLSYDAAQKARQRYGGQLVRVTTTIVQEAV